MVKHNRKMNSYMKKIITGIVLVVSSPLWFFVVTDFCTGNGVGCFTDYLLSGFVFTIFVPIVAALIGLTVIVNGVYDYFDHKKK